MVSVYFKVYTGKANFTGKSKQNNLYVFTSELKIDHSKAKEFQLFLTASMTTSTIFLESL